MMFNFKAGDIINRGGGNQFKVHAILSGGPTRGEVALVESLDDGQFAPIYPVEDGTGWDVMKSRGDYQEFPTLEEADAYAMRYFAGEVSVSCEHEFHEGVDENGQLVEPAYDVCVQCGARRD